MANVPPGQKTRVRRTGTTGNAPNDYETGTTGQLADPTSMFQNVSGVTHIHDDTDLVLMNRIVDPKSGTSGSWAGEPVHGPNSPLEHNRPSHPGAVELPPKAKSLFQVLSIQQKQISILGRMMKSLMDGMKMQVRDEFGKMRNWNRERGNI